jgi:periplasmic protein CpxP/Spy
MKRVICLAAFCALLMFSVGATAQEGGPPKGERQGQGRGRMMQTPQERVDRLATELNLTDDQKAKVKKIFEAEADKMKTLREDQSIPQEEKRPKMMEIRKASSDQLKALLDKEQQKKYEEMQAKMQERRPGGGEAPRPPQ